MCIFEPNFGPVKFAFRYMSVKNRANMKLLQNLDSILKKRSQKHENLMQNNFSFIFTYFPFLYMFFYCHTSLCVFQLTT